MTVTVLVGQRQTPLLSTVASCTRRGRRAAENTAAEVTLYMRIVTMCPHARTVHWGESLTSEMVLKKKGGALPHTKYKN